MERLNDVNKELKNKKYDGNKLQKKKRKEDIRNCTRKTMKEIVGGRLIARKKRKMEGKT